MDQSSSRTASVGIAIFIIVLLFTAGILFFVNAWGSSTPESTASTGPSLSFAKHQTFGGATNAYTFSITAGSSPTTLDALSISVKNASGEIVSGAFWSAVVYNGSNGAELAQFSPASSGWVMGGGTSVTSGQRLVVECPFSLAGGDVSLIEITNHVTAATAIP